MAPTKIMKAINSCINTKGTLGNREWKRLAKEKYLPLFESYCTDMKTKKAVEGAFGIHCDAFTKKKPELLQKAKGKYVIAGERYYSKRAELGRQVHNCDKVILESIGAQKYDIEIRMQFLFGIIKDIDGKKDAVKDYMVAGMRLPVLGLKFEGLCKEISDAKVQKRPGHLRKAIENKLGRLAAENLIKKATEQFCAAQELLEKMR
ncbi:hypothetical protein COU37_05555 [Candidatus Micrarchaeota archaeon CG10_big_fil_rev_8_21_14_0_10_45_29]|nr:MAG: hypothetical protein COU37_05555 [Candidatus Micrarchaeota archaeon CG10_big_fil_rev_8_21_14_0_10_45_29]